MTLEELVAFCGKYGNGIFVQYKGQQVALASIPFGDALEQILDWNEQGWRPPVTSQRYPLPKYSNAPFV